MTAPGAGAGLPWRKVAISTESSLPSSGARPTYSTRTRAAVIDPHDDGAAVGEIGDPGIARDRQGRMRAGDRMHVVDFAVGGEPAVEIGSVPGGDALGAIGDVLGRIIDAPIDGIGPADAVIAAALRDRLALLDHPPAVFGLGVDRRRATRDRNANEAERANAREPANAQPHGLLPSHATPPQPATTCPTISPLDRGWNGAIARGCERLVNTTLQASRVRKRRTRGGLARNPRLTTPPGRRK